MERNREGRRGGGGGGGSMNGHNHKRRRLEPQHNHHYSYEQEGTSNEEEEEEEEVDTAMAAIKGAEAGGSSSSEDDDDDLPPPVVVHHHRHSSGKLKKHPNNVKEEEEEEEAAAIAAAVAPVDLAVSVPRKLRTAMKKRYQESPPRHHANESDGGSNSKKRQKQQQQPSNGRIRLPPTNSKQASFEDSSLKSAAPRAKSSNHSKHRAAKIAKISPSKQEVEVAETLYDLARMFVNQARPNEPIREVKVDPKLEWKPEVKPEPASATSLFPASDATSAQSIQHAPSSGLGPSVAAASSPSSTQTPVHSGAPKKKRPHGSKVKVGGKPVASTATSPCISATSLGVATEFVDAKQVQQQTQSTRIPSAGSIVVPEVSLATGSSSSTAVPVSSLPTKQLQTVDNNSATSDKKSYRIEVSGHALVDNTSTKESVAVADKSENVVGSSVAREDMTKVENEERSMPSPPVEVACTTKVEIDLMAPPKSSEKTEENINQENINLSMEDAKEKEEVGSITVPEVIENALSNQDNDNHEPEPKAKNTEIYDETKESIVETGHEQCKDWYYQNNNEKVGETGEPTDYLSKREKEDVDKQMLEGAAKKVVEDLMDQTVDGSDLALLPSMTTRTESLPLSVSLGVTGWPGGVPSLGYHSLAKEASVGASYVSPVSVMATSTVGEKSTLTPALPPLPGKTRLSWKRCATHAYIGRFISLQEQAKRNLRWPAVDGNSTHLYGTKAYNSNAPLADGDAKFGNNSGIELTGSSVNNTHGLITGVNRLTVDSIKETGVSSAAMVTADVQGTVGISSSPYIDAHGKNSSSQRQIPTVREQTASSLQVGSTLGLAISQSAGVSAITVATTGDNIRMSSAMAFGGSSVPNNSLPICTGSGSTTGSLQPQFLHPVIQHSSFPISFSPGQAAPSTGGHVPTQQAAQYFNHPFYNTQLMQQQSNAQQPQQASSLTSGTSDTQKQQYQRFPSVCSFGPLGSPQQISWPPYYSTQTLLASAPQQQQQLTGKENTAAEAVSANEMKLSTAQRNIYSKSVSSVQVPTVNSSPSVLATGMPTLSIRPQDLNLMAAFGGKQDGTLQQKTEMHVQSHHHSMSQLQQQQQQQQNHIVIPSLQMSLKDVDSHMSPSSSANRGLTSASVLGLPPGASVIPPQGHTSFHGIGSQHQLSFQDQSASGQSHQLFMAASQQQPQHPVQVQRLVSRGLEDGRTNNNEGSCGKVGRLDDMKVPTKHQVYQPYREAPTFIQGSPTNGTFSLTRSCGSPRNLMVPSTDDGSSIAYASISIPAQQSSQSSKKMARSKATSSPVVSSAQAESSVITYIDKSPLNPVNFANVPPVQGVPFPGQILDSSNQGRRQGHSQQSAQTKGAGPLLSTSGTSTMPAAMARNQAQLSKSEQSALDTVSTSSRASPAPSVSTFSSSILSPSPASKSGGATLSKISSAKDSYSHQQKASSVATPEKKTLPAIVPNMSSILGPSHLSQNLSSMSIPVQMIPNQIQGQKKPHHKQQRKQQQTLQPLPQQSAQSMGSTQQRQQQQQSAVTQHYNIQQFPNQKQAQQLERHPSAQTTPQNHQLGDMQQQQIKQLQDHEFQIHPSYLRQQSPQAGQASSQNQQFENMQQMNVTHLQQHQQGFSAPFGFVMNGGIPSTLTLGTNAGSSPRSIVSDGTVISQGSILRPSTPANFTSTTSVPSSASQGIGASGSVQNSEYGSSRNSPLNRQ